MAPAAVSGVRGKKWVWATGQKNRMASRPRQTAEP
jgi:hypothetical protein